MNQAKEFCEDFIKKNPYLASLALGKDARALENIDWEDYEIIEEMAKAFGFYAPT